MKNQQLAHIWAQNEKHDVKGNNMFIKNAIIYSYGEHFPMAKWIENKNGDFAALVTSDKCSVSTSKHQSYVNRAIATDTTVFHVPLEGTSSTLTYDWRKLIPTFINHYKTQLKKQRDVVLSANKRKDVELTAYDHLHTEANNFNEFVGRKATYKYDFVLAAHVNQWRIEQQRKEEQRNTPEAVAKREQAAAKRMQLKIAKQQIAIEEWKNGTSLSHLSDSYNLPIYLRVHNNRIETSRGAEFPIEHAIKAFPIINKARAANVPLNFRELDKKPHLGHFTIDYVEANGDVIAGCHKVAFEEIERIAKQLGVA